MTGHPTGAEPYSSATPAACRWRRRSALIRGSCRTGCIRSPRINSARTATTLSGGNIPTEIWSEFMTVAHQGLPVSPLPGEFTPAAPLDPNLVPMETAPTTQAPERRNLMDALGDIFGG